MDSISNRKILLVGEPMGLFIAKQSVPLHEVTDWGFSVAGAELNVAIGLSRLEHSVTYMTRLGRDSFAKAILAVMDKNGVDTSLVGYDNLRKTGMMLKGKVNQGDPPIDYFRSASAASAISDGDIAAIDFSSFEGGIMHITGIFPALSKSCLSATYALIERGRKHNMLISFDPNLRPSLWENTETMVNTINDLAFLCDIILPGINEGVTLCGSDMPEEIADFYLTHTAKTVIVKLGASGAYAKSMEDDFSIPCFHVENIIDTVGAGDGFAAGVISAIAEGLSLKEAVTRGNAIGAIQVSNLSDNEGLPARNELAHFIEKGKFE